MHAIVKNAMYAHPSPKQTPKGPYVQFSQIPMHLITEFLLAYSQRVLHPARMQ